MYLEGGSLSKPPVLDAEKKSRDAKKKDFAQKRRRFLCFTEKRRLFSFFDALTRRV
jgi:hypothetical protein